MIASFINVIYVRPISYLKRIQTRHPWIDLNLELKCALCWVAIVAIMIADGVRAYGTGKWNGGYIALIVCSFIEM
jgi:hypothetical protein